MCVYVLLLYTDKEAITKCVPTGVYYEDVAHEVHTCLV